jgi:hypothetical protein
MRKEREAMRDISKELDFLKKCGYEVGESFVSPEGKMHTWVAGRACAFEHVAMLVTLENMKSKATSIDSLGLTDVPALWRRAADSEEATREVATKASLFEIEWRSLVQRCTPPPASLKDKQTLDGKGAALAERMVTFLARELPNLSVLTVAQTGG